MSAAADPVTVPRRRRRWLRTLLGFFVIFVLGPLATFVGYQKYQDHIATNQVREAEERADRVDPGWRWEEIEAKRAPLLDADNSIVCVRAAQALIPKGWPGDHSGQTWRESPPPLLLTDDQTAILQGELDQVAEALAQAAVSKTCHTGDPLSSEKRTR